MVRLAAHSVGHTPVAPASTGELVGKGEWEAPPQTSCIRTCISVRSLGDCGLCAHCHRDVLEYRTQTSHKRRSIKSRLKNRQMFHLVNNEIITKTCSFSPVLQAAVEGLVEPSVVRVWINRCSHTGLVEGLNSRGTSGNITESFNEPTL